MYANMYIPYVYKTFFFNLRNLQAKTYSNLKYVPKATLKFNL